MKDTCTQEERLKGGPCQLSGKLNDAIRKAGQKRPKLMNGLKIAFQVMSAALALFFGSVVLSFIGIAGVPAFLNTAFVGLTFQTGNFAFGNGPVAIVALLFFLYAILTFFMLPGSRFIGDLGVVYTVIFSMIDPMFLWIDYLIAPVLFIYIGWLIHRVVLGTVAFRYRAIKKSNENNA